MDNSNNTREAYETYAKDLLEDYMIPMPFEEWKEKMDKQDEAARKLWADARGD